MPVYSQLVCQLYYIIDYQLVNPILNVTTDKYLSKYEHNKCTYDTMQLFRRTNRQAQKNPSEFTEVIALN